MPVVVREFEALPGWPDAAALKSAISTGSLVILPDRITASDGALAAFYRPDAQELRVRAAAAGYETVLWAPEGSERGMYQESAADWILPVVVAAVLAIPGQLAADMIEQMIQHKPPDVPHAIIRYREVIVDGDELRLRELEGPANELVPLLRKRNDGSHNRPKVAELPQLSRKPPFDMK